MRRDSWLVELLDRHDRLKAALPSVRSGQLHWSIFKAVPGSGQIAWTQAADPGIDWLTDRIRITHIDGDHRTPHGIWLPAMPGWDVDGPVTHTTIALVDKTHLLNTPLGGWVTYPAGTPVIDTVTGIIRGRGESAISIVPSTLTTRVAQTWEPQDTWLTLVNDLLTSINYDSLRADMTGRLTLAPYLPPNARPTVATYGGDPADLSMRPAWSDEADIFALPTGVRIYAAGDETMAGMIGRADLPDPHPLSAVSRGAPWLLTEQGEGATQDVLDALAARRLDEALQVSRRVSVTHPIDDTDLTDVIHHRPAGLAAAIVERAVDLGVGAVVTDTVRHIYTGGDLPWPTR